MKGVLTMILFMALIFLGMLHSRKIPLWNDELFTIKNINSTSYLNLAEGKTLEGCNNPLFYLIQKFMEDERIIPILCMSGAITLLFWHFYDISIWLAGLSVAIMLLPKITWQHFAEDRPYALIVFLTTIEMIFLITQRWKYIGLVNILMALTAAITIVPIMFTATAAWMRGYRTLWSTIIPIIIITYYFSFGVYQANLHRLPEWSNRYLICLLPMAVIAICSGINHGREYLRKLS